MSKKNLLNESQVRQFMKLASLQPLTPGFVKGLSETSAREDIEEVRTGADPSPNLQSARRGSGRGRYAEDRLEEEDMEARDHDLEDGESDLEHADDLEADAAEDFGDIEGGVEVDADAGGERLISVDGLLTALEGFLEDQLDQEVEIDSTEMDVADEEEVEMDAELAPGPEDLEIEDELELQEKKLAHDSDAYQDIAADKGGTHTAHQKGAKSKKAAEKDERDEERGNYGTRTEAADELVEQITKRVAARILKSALSKNSRK